MPLVHHELCFGCGQTNLFGLLLEIERTDGATVKGRCFIKQDHQGPDRKHAHEGIVATALGEAMALVTGPNATAQALTVGFIGKAPIGAFLEIEAKVEGLDEAIATVTASVSGETGEVARARGTYSRG